MRAIRRFTVRTVLPEALAPLDILARNLRWCWHAPTTRFFESLDPAAWDRVHGDPIALLGEIGTERFAQLAADASVVDRARELAEDLDRYMKEPRWYQSGFAAPGKPEAIAYFSAEFGITAVLPQYSGGLGILAGDHLKSASDLGVPIVGVGLLYESGYFRQSLSRDGYQRETYPLIDPNNMPLTLLREWDGTPARVSLRLPGERTLNAQVWVAEVGRVPLLLLDSSIPDNDPVSRNVTDRLYGGSKEHRMEQELLLGVGGVKALRLYSRLTGAPAPSVYHCNEGHAGFLAVERLRELMEGEEHLDLGTAIEAVRSGTLFTTHTPVPAGIDRFDRGLVTRYLDAMPLPGVSTEEVVALGNESYEGGDPSVFNMAVLGLRMARRANGVAKLHGRVSRQMFASLWAGFDVDEVPITSVTNGVHGPTWRAPAFQEMAERYLAAPEIESGGGWLTPAENGGVPDDVLWATRRELRERLVASARRRVRSSWLERGASPAELGWVDNVLDPDVLTIGFARRVPTYKRLTLMLNDPERLTRLLTDPERPIQIVVAGKSHPDDEPGVGLIQRLVQFTDDPRVRERIVFLPDYDIAMAQTLMPGCDVWLNNPLRPLEASGTSGMKCALNGALNLSILDGWWDEMYDGANGWAIPTADGVEDPQRRDRIEASALYDLIEGTVAPRFYDRDGRGIPRRWMEMMRHTLSDLGPKVQATRMVRDYVERLYVPVSDAHNVLDVPGHEAARSLASWKAKVRSQWGEVRVDYVEAHLPDVAQIGDSAEITAQVSLGALSPQDVTVEVLAGRVGADDEIHDFSTTELPPVDAVGEGRWVFRGSEALEVAGPFGLAVRVVPRNPLMAAPTELGLVAVAAPSTVTSEQHTSFGD
ncbi:MAG: alpha-glucan family phosphorylase [Actinomyces sp.]|nr:alpha-glucan family phosphorylase [Actinomyces sp.]MCI1661359.1 alpha-glucan family phosphorylase [Actinomyces sp.]